MDTAVFRPEPGENFQILNGFRYDGELFRVLEYAKTTRPKEIHESLGLDHVCDDVVKCYLLERHHQSLVGTAFHAFPACLMREPGSRSSSNSVVRPRAQGERCPNSYKKIETGETDQITCSECERSLHVQAIIVSGTPRSYIYPQHKKPT